MRKTIPYNRFYSLLLRNSFIVAAGLFIDAFLIRFAFLLISDNFSRQEPMLNIITSLHAITVPGIMENIFYLQPPFFLYSIAGAVKLGCEQVISARFLCLVFGSFSIVTYYFLVKKIFNPKIALFSGILLYCYSMHIIASILTLPDIFAFIFCVLSLLMLRERKYLFSGIFCAIGCGYSYFVWLAIPVLTVLIFMEGKIPFTNKLRNCLSFLPAALIFPLIWNMAISHTYQQGWLWYKNFYNADSLYTFLYNFGLCTRQIFSDVFSGFGPVLSALIVLGIIFLPKKRKDKGCLFFILTIMFMLSLNFFRQEIKIYQTGILLISAMLIPYLVYGLIQVFKTARLKQKEVLFLIIVIIGMYLLYRTFLNNPKAPQPVKQVSQWIKDNVDKDHLVILSPQQKDYHGFIVMETGLPQANFRFYESTDDLKALDKEKHYFVLPAESIEAMDQGKYKKVIELDQYIIYKDISKL
jgi:4-amino-4-deoxy-L-arabinose transferase-like glycosyltransferase